MRSKTNRVFLGIVQVALATALYACSSDDENDGGLDSNPTGSGASAGKGGTTGSSGTTSTGGSSSGGTSGSTGSGGSGNTGNTGNTGNIPTEACMGLAFDESANGGAGGAEACTGVSVEAEHVDVDIFIMMDRSSSMGYEVSPGLTRWDALKAAVQDFVQSPDAASIGAGLGFFSKSGIGNDDVDCDANAYAVPEVPITPLADVGTDMANAIDATPPAGLTPTLPALQGAIMYAQSWATDHPGRASIVVLVTDGYPTQCGSGPDAVAQVAEDGYTSPEHVRTYVIGVGDVARFNLDNYARAGGTKEAYLTDEGDITTSFTTALNNITNSDVACEFTLPDPPDQNTDLDTEKVQVVHTPSAGDPEEVPYVAALGNCADSANGGWYYDNEVNPSKILVCPCTCASFGAGRVDVRLGCKPRLGLR